MTCDISGVNRVFYVTIEMCDSEYREGEDEFTSCWDNQGI